MSGTKESILWRTSGGKARPRWSEETLQSLPKSSKYYQSPGNRLHWIEQSGVASSEREQMIMKQSESAKQKESTKPEPMDHYQSRHAFSELTCSIYNRQFRAKVGLISHQAERKHKARTNGSLSESSCVLRIDLLYLQQTV